jgi:hypothetical protein
MKKINSKEVMIILRKVIKGREKFVYIPPTENCVYFHKNKPSCLIGFVFDEIGLKEKDLICKKKYKDDPNTMGIDYLKTKGIFTAKAKKILCVAQYKQDFNVPFGEVLDYLEERFPLESGD